MPNQSTRLSVRPNVRSGVRAFARSSVLESCARAAAKASGYVYTGKSIITAARFNPRAAQFVAIAEAVIAAYDQEKGA